MFLTHAEFSLIMDGMGERYKAFTNFLVMTGTRFGEATALTVADVDLLSRPPTARINKAWKRDGQSQFYIGATKTGAGKRTIGLNPALVELYPCPPPLPTLSFDPCSHPLMPFVRTSS